jgi:hypothetical protein
MLGNLRDAGQAAREALNRARQSKDDAHIIDALTCVAWVSDLAGDSRGADDHFAEADARELSIDHDGTHLYSLDGVRWASFLGRTGRIDAALRLTRDNLELSEQYGWWQDAARCQVLLGSLSIAAGESADSEELAKAIKVFREGDYLVDLAEGLVVAAQESLAQGDLRQARHHVDELRGIAGPRRLVPLVAAALNVQARIAAERFRSRHDADSLATARDHTNNALRRSTTPQQLRWEELTALQTHALLDRLDGTDRGGWAAQARELEAKLLPPDLRAHPLAHQSTS